jgi:hypothetical protein
VLGAAHAGMPGIPRHRHAVLRIEPLLRSPGSLGQLLLGLPTDGADLPI